MAEEQDNGTIRDALQDLATHKLRSRVTSTVKKLTNGASQECNIESHKVVCEGTSLALEMLLAIMSAMNVHRKASLIWAGIGSVTGPIVLILFIKLLSLMGVAIEPNLVTAVGSVTSN